MCMQGSYAIVAIPNYHRTCTTICVQQITAIKHMYGIYTMYIIVHSTCNYNMLLYDDLNGFNLQTTLALSGHKCNE